MIPSPDKTISIVVSRRGGLKHFWQDNRGLGAWGTGADVVGCLPDSLLEHRLLAAVFLLQTAL